MLNGHLSDEQIQELAMNATPATEAATHAANCPDCRTRLENYKLLIIAIEQEPAPAFSFDLAAAVVAQIETPPAKPFTKGLWWIFAATLAVILTGVGIYFGEYMPLLFDGIKSIGIYLMILSCLVFAIMLVIDQFKIYQKKMKLLDMQ
jgi:hypothetical protein